VRTTIGVALIVVANGDAADDGGIGRLGSSSSSPTFWNAAIISSAV
jgi:hypothetical protein